MKKYVKLNKTIKFDTVMLLFSKMYQYKELNIQQQQHNTYTKKNSLVDNYQERKYFVRYFVKF